jgi:hypothetical protein
MTRYQISGTAIYGALIFLQPQKDFFPPVNRKQFGPFYTLEEARAFYDAEKVEPWDHTVPCDRRAGEFVVTTRYFRQGGPLEKMNPLDADQWVDGTPGHAFDIMGCGAIYGLITIEGQLIKGKEIINFIPDVLSTVCLLEHFLKTEEHNDFSQLCKLSQRLHEQTYHVETNATFSQFADDVYAITIEYARGLHYLTTTVSWKESIPAAVQKGKQLLHEEMAKINVPTEIVLAFLEDLFGSQDDVRTFLSAKRDELAVNVLPDHKEKLASYFYKSSDPNKLVGRRDETDTSHYVPLTIDELRTDLFLYEYAHRNGVSMKK